MIWLSTMAGAQLCSIYFEIRDIEIRRTGSSTSGVVCGLLGDGRCELCCEVFLGDAPRVQILSQWSDSGQVEGFDESIDESDLERQLLTTVQRIFHRFATFTAPDLSALVDIEDNRAQKVTGFLAA